MALIDNLIYSYSGNRLNSVTDGVSGDHEVDFVPRGGNAYTYYNDGSLKTDDNKEITNIIYDTYLDKATEIQLTGGRWIKNYYDGAGRLFKREFSTGEYWDYLMGLVLKNGQPHQMTAPEGRAVYQNGSWNYEFFYQDHLGNTRVSFSASGNNLITNDISHYDPTGILLNGLGQVNGFENRFKWQDKESLALFGLGNIVDFEARYVDKTINRWFGVDLMAEVNVIYSPYTVNNNNPLLFIDPSGLDAQNTSDFNYSDGYSTQSYRNSTGNVAVSGTFENSDNNKPPIELQFDSKGNFKGTVDDGKKEASGAIVDDKGNVTRRFKLNDQRDASLIMAGKLKLNLNFPNWFNYYMGKAGTKESANLFFRFPYAAWNSLQREKMDFIQYLGDDSYKTLFLAGNVAYNNFDAGNFLWGMSMQKLGFDYSSVKIGSETNGFLNSKRQNGEGWGVTWGGDSIEDQQAIINGYFWNILKNK